MGHWLPALLISAGAGLLSAWGIGGGTLLLLCMTLLLGVEQREAQGINLLYFLPSAALALRCHWRNGYVRRDALLPAVLPGVACAAAGAWAATRLDVSLLRRPFGCFLLLCALAQCRGILSETRGEKEKQAA